MNLAKTLFTETQLEQLLKNGSDMTETNDHPPVAMLYMTSTHCSWLISELDPDAPDIAFGLCDLGMGFPEIGYVDLREIEAAQDEFRFLVPDTDFVGSYPLSVYAQAARDVGGITDDPYFLQCAAARSLKL